ncbi:unnamed protein product [Tilletia controversa]|nr:unnamed protein product [Tilletia controversa]
MYGRIRLPLCKAVFPVLSKTDTLENEVRLLQLGLQDAAEQGRERGVQLADAVQHSETLQAKAGRREEDLKRSKGTVVELQFTLDRVQAELLRNQGQLLDFQVRLENSEQRAAEQKRGLGQVRAEAAQKRVESDDVVAELQKILEWVEFATKEVQAARSKDLAEREEILVAALNKNAALEGASGSKSRKSPSCGRLRAAQSRCQELQCDGHQHRDETGAAVYWVSSLQIGIRPDSRARPTLGRNQGRERAPGGRMERRCR